jgi:hypothetical protein
MGPDEISDEDFNDLDEHDVREQLADEARDIIDPSEEMKIVAHCDVCDRRPGNRMVMAYGIETWVCDICSCVEQESKNVDAMGRVMDHFLSKLR